MLKITSLYSGINIIKKTGKIAFNSNKPVTDVFVKNNRKSLLPVIEENPNTKDFTETLNEAFSCLPVKVLNLLKSNNFQIYTADDINSICQKYNVKTNPNKEVLGFTHTNFKTQENFFAFSTKLSGNSVKPVVNHEIGHSICDLMELDSSEQFNSKLKEDISNIKLERKLDNLSEEERKLIFSKLFNSSYVKNSKNEIIADLIAWKLGQGCYGSDLSLNKPNPELMIFLFPKTYHDINKFKLFKME